MFFQKPLPTLILSLVLLGACVSPSVPPPDAVPPSDTLPSDTAGRPDVLQVANDLPKTPLRPKRSQELEDSGIGIDLLTYHADACDSYGDPELVYALGFKWIRISADDYYGDPLDWQRVEVEPGEYWVDPVVDDVISDYADNGINIVLGLNVGNRKNRPDTTRFKDRSEVERYCAFVRFMVHHFKGRVKYFEIWNEPGDIEVEDYAALIEHVAPAIREEYPEAKIVMGAIQGDWATGYPGYEESERYTVDTEYLNRLLRSGVAPLVDTISWHPFYCNRPDDQYYHDYPQMVEEIQQLAVSQGFDGEYLAEEILWKTYGEEGEPGEPVSKRVAGKYYARAIVMHRGLDVIVSSNLWCTREAVQDVFHNLCDTMAGAAPVSLPIVLQSEAANIRSYTFSLPGSDRLLALWTDGVAVDDDPGVRATATIPGMLARKVTGIDVLRSFEQELMTDVEGESLVIRDLLVRDYPMLLRVTS
jgi:hypothetical protein